MLFVFLLLLSLLMIFIGHATIGSRSRPESLHDAVIANGNQTAGVTMMASGCICLFLTLLFG